MASTYKQSFLKLNKFVGSDKPKMDDYNYDNSLIDQNAMETNQRLISAENHAKDQEKHITAEERGKWNKLQWVIGKYEGNGQGEREISLGFSPRLGFVFQENEFPMTGYDTDCALQSEQRLAIITELGSTLYSATTPDGFVVCSTNNVQSDQRMPRMNINGQSYIYVMFK